MSEKPRYMYYSVIDMIPVFQKDSSYQIEVGRDQANFLFNLGSNKNRYRFLQKKSQPPLVPDLKNPRENVVEDWNHIHETVIDLGVPEMADIIGGQMFAGGHLR